MGLRQYPRAIQAFTEAIRLKPDDEEIYNFLGTARRGGDLTGAIADFDKATELNPKNARAYGDRGIAQLLLWKDTEAQMDVAKCFELDQGMRKVFELLIEKAKAKHAGNRYINSDSELIL